MRSVRRVPFELSTSHEEALIEELPADFEFAAEYLAAAREDVEDPEIPRMAEDRCVRAGHHGSMRRLLHPSDSKRRQKMQVHSTRG